MNSSKIGDALDKRRETVKRREEGRMNTLRNRESRDKIVIEL